MDDLKKFKFKIGDKVKCIDLINPYLIKNKIYTITNVDHTMVSLIDDAKVVCYCKLNRFELVEENNNNEKIRGRKLNWMI